MNPTAIEKKLLHYTGKAIADYNMIQKGDRVLVCLSGGKDSFAMLKLLQLLVKRSGNKFSIFVLTLNQMQPGWDDSGLRTWLEEKKIEHAIIDRDTYSIVKEKVKPGKSLCGLCSRLRRGNIYGYAQRNGFVKIALGHHRDDLIESLLMAIFYNGEVRSMPPKLITNDKQHIVIRPMVYCQEKDIITYAKQQEFPIIPCGLCNAQENMMRSQMKELIAKLAKSNPKVPSNLLHSLRGVRVSQLMDKKLHNFVDLEKELVAAVK